MRRPSPTNWAQVYRALLHQTSITYWEMSRPPPTNRVQVYRALLHQTSRNYWEMRPYPVQMDTPTDWAQVYRALLHQTSRNYWEMRRPSPTNWAQVYRALLHQTSMNLLRHMHINPVQMDPPIEPKCTKPCDTKPVEPIEKYRPYPVQMDTCTNWAQVYRALLHQTSETYWEICTYPVQMDRPIEPKCTKPYWHQTSRTYWEIQTYQVQMDTCTNWTQVYRALLHQTSRTYWEIQTYPVQMDTCTNWAQVYRALLHQTSGTYWEICTYPVQMDPPIEPKCTELCYTKPVETIEKWGGPPCTN